MRKIFLVLGVIGLVLGCAAAALGDASNPTGPPTISVSEGVVGTTVTVTGNDCGAIGGGLRAGGDNLRTTGTTTYVPDTARLIVFVAEWPEPFPSGVEGDFGNDGNGIATATFQVPDVPDGTYDVTVECRGFALRAGDTTSATPHATPNAIGSYTQTLTFTVISAAPEVTPAVEAQATTTG